MMCKWDLHIALVMRNGLKKKEESGQHLKTFLPLIGKDLVASKKNDII